MGAGREFLRPETGHGHSKFHIVMHHHYIRFGSDALWVWSFSSIEWRKKRR